MKIATFIQQITNNSSPESLLREHWDFLTSIKLLDPLLKSYKSGQLSAAPCLDQISKLIATIKEEKPTVPQKILRKAKTPKRYCIVLFISNGYDQLEILNQIWEAAQFGEAERLADRLLFKREDALFAEISQIIGEKVIRTRIPRNDAVSRMLRRGRGPVCQRGSKTTKSLGFTPKAKPTRSRRSYG